MSHLRLVVPGQEAARGAALGQARGDLSRRELDRVLTMLEGQEEFTAADVAAAIMVVAVNIAGAPDEPKLDVGLHAYLMDRLNSLSLSSKMLTAVCAN